MNGTRTFTWLMLLLTLALGCAGLSRLERQADRAFRQRNWDQAVAFYSRLVEQHPERTEYQARFWWARMRAAEVHRLRAETAVQKKDWETALVELEMAVDLDPTNSELQARLEQVRAHFRGTPAPTPVIQPVMPKFEDIRPQVVNQPIDLFFKQTPLPAVLSSMAEVAGLQLVLDPDVPAEPVTFDFRGISFEDALRNVTQSQRLFYRFLNQNTLLVAPDTEEKHRQYRDFWAYTFHIQHTRAANVQQMLRQALQLNYVAHDAKTETITVMGTRPQIEAAARLVAQIDVPPAEVLIHVDLLEISRSVLQQYGLSFASGEVPGVETRLQPDAELRLDPGPILSRSDFVLVNLPSLVARLLKQSGHTRLLASIPIRTVAGETGTVAFGSEVPVPQTTFVPIATGGAAQQPITSFIYRTVGLNLSLNPRVHPDGQITIKIEVESSSIAGTGFAGIPIFATSRITKTIRLRPNETSLIAGLIRRQSRETTASLPGLEHVPVLGELFRDRKRERQENEIIVLLTPYILRQRPHIMGEESAVPVPPPEGRRTLGPTFTIPRQVLRPPEERSRPPERPPR